MGIVQPRYLFKVPGQFAQKAAVTGADLQSAFALGAGAQQQLAGLLGVLLVIGNQLLLGVMLLRMAGKKRPALLGPLLLDLLQTRSHGVVQSPIIQFVQQGAVNGAFYVLRLGQAAAVENGVTFPPLFDQAASGQHFQVMAHAGLFHGHDVAQLQNAETALAQHLQNLQTQRITSGLEKARQMIGDVRQCRRGGGQCSHGAESTAFHI